MGKRRKRAGSPSDSEHGGKRRATVDQSDTTDITAGLQAVVQKAANKKAANVSDQQIGKDMLERYQLRLPELEKIRQNKIDSLSSEKLQPTLPGYGVYFIKHMSSHATKDAIAGYLNCPNVSVLYQRFVDNDKARDILEALYRQGTVSTSALPLALACRFVISK